MNITFTDTVGIDDIYTPVPISRYLPEWYKETPDYVNGERKIYDGRTPHTIKKCMPVFDAMTAGYIIVTPADVQVTQRDGGPYFEWPNFGLISFHAVEQAPKHPNSKGISYPKWTNPWAIKTPSGYSCLFISPMHNPNGIFTILPGIVDTDTYTAPVNFPFVLNKTDWEGIIPVGTPIAQVIPFKRDKWNINIGGEKEQKEQHKALTRLRSIWFNSYKKQFWSRKEFK